MSPEALRSCESCGAQYSNRSKLAKYCKECRKNRNGARDQQMFVAVDGEGLTQIYDTVRMVTFSFGRECGCADSLIAPEGLHVENVMEWLLQNLGGKFTCLNPSHAKHFNKTYNQVPIGFFINWDVSSFLAGWQGVHRVQYKGSASHRGTLCFDGNKGCTCDKPHHNDPKVIEKIKTEGEGDFLVMNMRTGYGMTSTPKRRWYIEHRPNGARFHGSRRIDIHDVGTSFEGSLEASLDAWRPQLEAELRERIRWGKSHGRTSQDHEWSLEFAQQMARYSEAENIALTRMARKLLDAMSSINVPMKPRELYGSGSIAAASMKANGVPRRLDCTQQYLDLSVLTYFGGLIDTPCVGYVQVPEGSELQVFKTDLVSAYPSVMVKLPCMREECGHWETADDLPEHAEIGYANTVSWDVETASTGPFSVRLRNGGVQTPLMCIEGTVTTIIEYRAAIEQFPGDVHAESFTYWVRTCEHESPFKYIGEIYDQRAQVKREMKSAPKASPEYAELDARQLALKKVMNSSYGKLAQRRPVWGSFTNMHYAAYITAATRTKIRRKNWELEADGGYPIYNHTDSCTSLSKTPGKIGKELGDFDLEATINTGYFSFQPGIALDPESMKNSASRGVRKLEFRESVMRWLETTDLSTRPETWPVINVPANRMLSYRAAAIQNKPHHAGRFFESVHPIDVSRISKRDFSRAVQVPGVPTLWKLPPPVMIPDEFIERDAKRLDKTLNDIVASSELESEAFAY